MRRLATLVLLFVGYVVAAKVGLSFAAVHPSASAIWPPTGIAIAAFLLWGRGVWPAIFAGAFLANVTTEGTAATSLAIAAGNTLEGALGAYLVQRFAHGRRAFDRPQDIFRFVALAGGLSPLVSATIGVTTLAVARYAPWSAYGPIWATWWLGDAAGAILVAPLLLVWGSAVTRSDRGSSEWLEAALLIVLLTATAAVVFGGFYPRTRNYPLAFLCVPALVWIAFRFGQRETATAIVIISGVATWGTFRGLGPFRTTPLNTRLLFLQAVMGTTALTAMTIAALVAEYRRLLAVEQRARADAEAANLAKDTFLAMLGHELRNPLAAITAAIYLEPRAMDVRAGAQERTGAAADRIRQILASQVGQLNRLVDDLLDVTRLNTGKIVLHPSRVELLDLVERSLEPLAATGQTARHDVTCDGQPVWADVDATRIEQVVTNLVTNALKYTPPGGTIRVTVAPEREWATLRVEDNGIGIAPEMLARIFDLFAQGDPGPGSAKAGLGIGLTLVKRLVELHGGIVEASSRGPNRGSVFTVRVPAASPERATPQPSQAPAVSEPRRVLVVEDRADTRELLCVALQLAGHEVFEADDGLRGIEAASRCQPDVALIDIGLPGCDGYEVARQVRRQADGRKIFLVALTGFGQPEDRRRAEEAGFDEHLVKPVEPTRLTALLASRAGTQG